MYEPSALHLRYFLDNKTVFVRVICAVTPEIIIIANRNSMQFFLDSLELSICFQLIL